MQLTKYNFSSAINWIQKYFFGIIHLKLKKANNKEGGEDTWRKRKLKRSLLSKKVSNER